MSENDLLCSFIFDLFEANGHAHFVDLVHTLAKTRAGLEGTRSSQCSQWSVPKIWLTDCSQYKINATEDFFSNRYILLVDLKET